MSTMTHDPGGKVKVKLDDSVVGKAFLHGPGECYRTWLTRVWGRRPSPHEFLPAHFVLWIGLNPSTADASYNDQTIRREMDFSMSWDHDAMVKVNVCDYRATYPAMLLAPGVAPCSRINLPLIRDIAKHADRIVCAWGAAHRGIEPYATAVERALRGDGHDLVCLGLTKNGQPRHPSRLASNTQLETYRGLAA